MAALLYLLFFASGAAALVYQVAWIRHLSLVFGGSHLAVTTVLAVFMGGLALGGRIFGRRADRTERPLRMYGLLELGIAAFALTLVGLVRIYPHLYVPLARVTGDHPLGLSTVRVLFAVVALAGPTTLMGGTLPVLARFVSERGTDLGRHLSFLYGFNTLGAMAGSLAAGFWLLARLGLARTTALAIVTNVLLGAIAAAWPEKRAAAPPPEPLPTGAPEGDAPAVALTGRAILWGTALSGFCALGYEVLWTRVLGMVAGSSIYSVTTMLVAFLGGIAAGSQAYGVVRRRLERPSRSAGASLVAFGGVQIAIGLVALSVTAAMRDLPSHAMRLQHLLSRGDANEFEARLGSGFAVAFAYMFAPAFLMGVAFPMAGRVHTELSRRVGRAIGEVLTWNTVGAIAGAAVSGYVLVYAVGVERALQVLSALNVGFGVWIAARVTGHKGFHRAVATASLAGVVALFAFPDRGRLWDRKSFAVFRNNQRDAFVSEELGRRSVTNTELLYAHEGVNETISVIRVISGEQSILVNGRAEASTAPADVQCQRALGHVPMLLHPNPRRVFVLGLGTGMTLGAASIHPEVEQITLAEIEAGVVPAARTFAEYNHRVLDDPRLRIVINDGRNFLLTTDETYDVITADPVQPWSAGAAYLFTDEYYGLMASRLRPGGVACQWLPLYEMSVDDVRSVVRTFAGRFAHTLVWQTHYDAEVIGSNEPIVLDAEALERRLADPAVRRSLEEVAMGTAEDFLAHFLMGPRGVAAYAAAGTVNTDDNLHLEFSTPKSMGVRRLMGDNVEVLARHREDLLPHLAAAARIYDPAHAMVLRGVAGGPELADRLNALETAHPAYAPYRFLLAEIRRGASREPVLVRELPLAVLPASGPHRILRLSAVTMRLMPTRAVVVFADPDTQEVLGQIVLDADGERLDADVPRVATEALEAVDTVWREESAAAARLGRAAPAEDALRARIRAVIAAKGGS